MWPEDKGNSYTLYLDGVPITLGELPEITVPAAESMEPEDVFSFQPMRLTVRFKMPKRWRCRNRKRFIKPMMSEGISRNYAV